MSKKRNKSRPDAMSAAAPGAPTEDFRIYLDETIKEFMNDPERRSFQFPADYTKPMRAYIHDKCLKLGIAGKSFGKEPNRYMTITKKEVSSSTEEVSLVLSSQTQRLLASVQELRAGRNVEYKRIKMQCDSINKFFHGSVMRVQPPNKSNFTEFRKSLPIYHKRQHILDSIQKHQVVIISAETGSGKTTQIPQYIIEEAALKQKDVRVICTQPRRLSTVSVSERVAAERGEQIAQTIGYQIKLEQKLGVETAVIYCTNGVLLRTLMSGDECFKHITHIIVDEIHERDKFTDFLMIVLRECIRKFPHLRLILMSATMDMDAFVEYFDKTAFVLNIEGRSFSCVSWFLDDILHHINYENPRMKQLRLLRERNGAPGRAIVKPKPRENCAYAELDDECKMELNEILARCFDQGNSADFDELMQLYLNENVNPNYQDWQGKTALMAASRHANFRLIEQLLNMGADMFLSSAEGITASGWAQQANNLDVVNMLTLYQQTNPGPEMFNNESGILADYDRTINDELVDYDLIFEVIKHIHYNLDNRGAILVFLPGYEDIVACQDRIVSSNMSQNDYKLFLLHGSMQMQAQHDVFQKCATKQKIILSTNIAETSITIDDVRFVVDSGKAKIKTYDARTGISSLRSEWISMANSRQRAGRAGRTQNGYCFHLYSVKRYESFHVNPIPEILRTPLYELCLQTKMLATGSISIAGFLNLAIDPPKKIAVEEAITTLKCLGALDDFENLTDLGQHLVQLSIEPRLGKMLIYSTIFKCLDPILTIVASMAQKDPFMLPSQPHLKQLALDKRKNLAEESLSDHMILIRAFQLWQDNKVQNRGYQFCNSYFISPAVMELITQTRSQLLSQLRAMNFVQTNAKESIGELNTNSSMWPVVKCCIAAGLYPNVALYNGRMLHTKVDKVHISGQSALKGSDYDGNSQSMIKDAWLLFDEISKPHIKTTVKTLTVITPLTVALICGHSQTDSRSLVLDDVYAFLLENPGVITLRNNVQHVIYKKIAAPHSRWYPEEVDTLRLLANVMMAEEMFYGIQSPEGIGQRPRITEMSLKTRPSFDHHHHRAPQRNNYYQHQRGGYHNYQQGPSRRQAPAGSDPRQIFPVTANYFLINPFGEKNIPNAMKHNTWMFTQQTQAKVFRSFTEGCLTILVFYNRRSYDFYGAAKLLNMNTNGTNRNCPIEWCTFNRLPYSQVSDIVDKIQMNDGFEIEGHIGQKLCVTMYEYVPFPGRYTSNKPRPILGNASRAGPSRNYY